MSGGGSTTTTSSSPPPQVLQAYGNLTNAATAQAQQPLQQYTGPLVSGFTPQQQAGFQTISNLQGVQAPYLNAATQEFGAATTPLWQTLPQYSSGTVNKYLSPYTSDVTNSLTNLYNQQNAQQQQQVQGSAVGQGAYGGDRMAVAQALTAQQQNLAQAPTLAQVEQQGFQGAQGEFNTQQQQQLAAEQANAWLASQAAFGLGSLGSEALTTGLTGAQANIGAGGMQQALAQEQLNIPYQQFQQTQAYPYQQLSFLAPIVEGTGSLSGGIGSTTTPGPSSLSQIGGLATAGAGLSGLFNGSGGGGFSADQIAAAQASPDFLSASPSGVDFGGAARGGRIGMARGGNIVLGHGAPILIDGLGHRHFAPGGMALPPVPGVGPGVPSIDLSFIPTAAPGGQRSQGMMSPFQPITTTTQSSSGGGIGDILGAAASIGKFFLKDGGRTGMASGGNTDAAPTMNGTAGGFGLPAVPTISLDYITRASGGAQGLPHGAGPPQPPKPPTADDPMKDAQGLASGMSQIGKILDSPSGGSSTVDASARWESASP